MLKKRKICIKIFIVSFSLILILFSGVSIVRPRDCNRETRSVEFVYDFAKGINCGIDLYKQKTPRTI